MRLLCNLPPSPRGFPPASGTQKATKPENQNAAPPLLLHTVVQKKNTGLPNSLFLLLLLLPPQ